MTARESSTASGNARFFEVLAGDAALACEEWTIVEVWDAIFEIWLMIDVEGLHERWENKGTRLQVKHERKGATPTR